MQVFSVHLPQTIDDKIYNQARVIALDKPLVAVEWFENIQDQIKSLSTLPKRCPIAPENINFDFEIRHLIIGNYRVLFSVENSNVEIIDFKAGKQNKP